MRQHLEERARVPFEPDSHRAWIPGDPGRATANGYPFVSDAEEHLLDSLRKAGLSEEEARAEVARLAAGDVWAG
ncbi:hypothetical protein SPF06_11950 [Sinomonas sp. JGH33]|uniref:Uncharacterized protein n=1 Tax=Sinomonas terricola TaxID=3110330 RepID=A0ABU5T8M0_9MICC|nr:hypothetical protein [Sinomonas sp. JGH33]MEA5455436.1 hypothetical protein [Sinomonas sp. JGH33]